MNHKCNDTIAAGATSDPAASVKLLCLLDYKMMHTTVQYHHEKTYRPYIGATLAVYKV